MYTDPYSGASPEQIAGAMSAYLGCVAIFSLLFVALYLWLFYRILTKAGYSGWLTLLNLVPLGSIILVFWLAFGNWPALQGRGVGPMTGGPQYPPTYPPAGQPPVTPPSPGYQPPTPPMAQTPPAPPSAEPRPVPPASPGYGEPPAAPEDQPPAPPSAPV